MSNLLDREAICPDKIDCILSVRLLVNNNTKLTLPIKINDLNDQKPFFYQSEIQIDLNSIVEQQQHQNKKIDHPTQTSPRFGLIPQK
jgi:hypothetical protein